MRITLSRNKIEHSQLNAIQNVVLTSLVYIYASNVNNNTYSSSISCGNIFLENSSERIWAKHNPRLDVTSWSNSCKRNIRLRNFEVHETISKNKLLNEKCISKKQPGNAWLQNALNNTSIDFISRNKIYPIFSDNI